MRLLTDDGRFGFRISPTVDHGLFRFQMIVGGDVLGDEEPCILGSAVKRMRNLHELSDARLDIVSTSPEGALSVLRSDDVLHDAAILALAESLDGWLLYGYRSGANVIILAKLYDKSGLGPPATASVIPSDDYGSLIDEVQTYWLKCLGSAASQ